MTGLFGQLDALVDCGVNRNAIHPQQLKCTEPQGNQNFGIELCIRVLQERAKAPVEINLPAQNAKSESSGEIAVCGRESCDALGPQHRVRMSPAFAERFENGKSSATRWRNRTHRINPAVLRTSTRRLAETPMQPYAFCLRAEAQ